LKKNIIANIVGKFWSILSNFLFIPLYIKFLGFESYAIISFTLIIAGVMAVLDSGLTATLSREFARNDQSIEEKRRIFNTLETSYFLIIIIISILIFFFSNFIANNWLNLNTISPKRVSLFIKIIGFEVGFRMLFRFYMGGVLGFEKQVKANILQIGWGILRNGLVVFAIFFISTLEMFFIWQLIATIIFTSIMRLSLQRILNGKYNFSFKPTLEKEVFLKIWRFAGGMLLISLVAALNTQMDKLAISKLLAINNLGYYTLAVSLSTGILVLVSPISVALLPRFTALYSERKRVEAAELFKKVYLLVVILTFSFMANMVFYGNELIWIWTGNMELAKNAGIFLPVLSFSFAMLALQVIPFNIAIANGYTKLNNILGILSLFLTMPGYLIATKLYGAIGAAYIFCFIQTITIFIYIYFINKKFLHIDLYDLMFKKMILPLLFAIIMAYGLSLIPNLFVESRILTLAWIGTSTLVTLFVLAFTFRPLNVLKQLLLSKMIANK
jgi:O-antigen/teichoic acid export membrane protein